GPRIFILSRGDTAVRDTAPATPPATRCLSWDSVTLSHSELGRLRPSSSSSWIVALAGAGAAICVEGRRGRVGGGETPFLKERE
ncbi:hypothetical protein GBAR_LOCUS461, partial [Geodia barretti]